MQEAYVAALAAHMCFEKLYAVFEYHNGDRGCDDILKGGTSTTARFLQASGLPGSHIHLDRIQPLLLTNSSLEAARSF